jgi:hypothetical protein
MTKQRFQEHHGVATSESLAAYQNDSTQLLQCSECGAWVNLDDADTEGFLLEAHVDRRPKQPRNRVLVPFRRSLSYPC